MEQIPENKNNLPESFAVEFLNEKGLKIREMMYKIGDFTCSRSGPRSDDEIYFVGERRDGTSIEIVIKKGSAYQAPATKTTEEAEQ